MKTNLAGKTRRRRREERERAGKRPPIMGRLSCGCPLHLESWNTGELFVLQVVEHRCGALAAGGDR